uniref:Uncharacterized protein n=1 Tax=viral metagenome TaxID=1070528 RepID=A0A6M3JC74_9ZZZZ
MKLKSLGGIVAEWRAIKIKFWRDKKVTRLSHEARLLALGMIALTDDEGYLEGDAETLKNELYPSDSDVAVEMIQGWLDELAAVDVSDPFIIRYLGRSKVVICFPKFADHQPAGVLRKDRIKPSKLKSLVESGILSAEVLKPWTVVVPPPELVLPCSSEPRQKSEPEGSLTSENTSGPITATDAQPQLGLPTKPERTGKQATNDEILDAVALIWKRSRKPEPSMAVYQEIATYCKELNRAPDAVVRSILTRANSKPDVYALTFSRARKLPPELESGPKLDNWQIAKAKTDGRKTGLSMIGDVFAAANETSRK